MGCRAAFSQHGRIEKIGHGQVSHHLTELQINDAGGQAFDLAHVVEGPDQVQRRKDSVGKGVHELTWMLTDDPLHFTRGCPL